MRAHVWLFRLPKLFGVAIVGGSAIAVKTSRAALVQLKQMDDDSVNHLTRTRTQG